jgi:hypothetical protein
MFMGFLNKFKEKFKPGLLVKASILTDAPLLFSICSALLLLHFGIFIGTFTVDVPFWDEWTVIDLLSADTPLKEILSHQNNEHRIGFGLLVLRYLAWLTNWSQYAEVFLLATFFVLSASLLLYFTFKEEKSLGLLHVIVPLILFNILQYENITWGFQVVFVFPFLAVVLWVLTFYCKRYQYYLKTIIGFFAAYSSFHGLLLPVMTIISVFRDRIIHKEKAVKVYTIFTFNLLIIFTYFIGYQKQLQTALTSGFSHDAVFYFISSISNGFFLFLPADSASNLVFYTQVFLVMLTLYFFFFGLRKVIQKDRSFHVETGFGILLFGLLFSLMISLGRSGFGPGQALSSKYNSFLILIPLGIFFLAYVHKWHLYIQSFLLVFLLYTGWSSSRGAYEFVNSFIEKKQAAFTCYKNSFPEDYNKCYKIYALYAESEFIHEKMPLMFQLKNIITNAEDLGLNVFNNNHIPGGISRDKPFYQTFKATRNNLRGIYIFLSTFNRRISTPYRFYLLDKDCKTPVRESDLKVKIIKDNQFFPVYFSPVPDSKSKFYCFTINPTGEKVPVPLTVQFSEPGIYKKGTAFYEGKQREDDIVFQILY